MNPFNHAGFAPRRNLRCQQLLKDSRGMEAEYEIYGGSF